jgi:hypothetical protein
MGESTSNEGSATTGGNALPEDDPPDVTRFKAAAAKRVQAHRWRRRLGLRCLTVRGQRPRGAPSDQHQLPLLESRKTPTRIFPGSDVGIAHSLGGGKM